VLEMLLYERIAAAAPPARAGGFMPVLHRPLEPAHSTRTTFPSLSYHVYSPLQFLLQFGDIQKEEDHGVLLIEIAEMDALIKASSSASKGYLTRRHDRFRPPYGRHPINLPRQCVFAGTINPPAGGYLQDPTGSRRLWPVACHGMIDRNALERDRDQLWAEAVGRYKAGAKWWLETPELEALATAEQALRFKSDVWKEPIARWLGKRKETSVADVLQGALGIAPQEQTHSAEIRVAKVLTELGFTQHRPRKNGRRRRYRRESS
jgi:predicted P-loop ATPase